MTITDVLEDGWRALDDGSLERVQALHDQLFMLVVERDQAIRSARARGATWSQLGSVLGVSPQAVQKKFGARPAVSAATTAR